MGWCAHETTPNEPRLADRHRCHVSRTEMGSPSGHCRQQRTLFHGWCPDRAGVSLAPWAQPSTLPRKFVRDFTMPGGNHPVNVLSAGVSTIPPETPRRFSWASEVSGRSGPRENRPADGSITRDRVGWYQHWSDPSLYFGEAPQQYQRGSPRADPPPMGSAGELADC